RNSNIIIDVSNFDFPDPALDIALNPTYNANSAPAASNQDSSGPSATGSSRRQMQIIRPRLRLQLGR
ncbi:MAG: hypothetical protein ACKOEB_07425, partial [Actinomycetota bacterium]